MGMDLEPGGADHYHHSLAQLLRVSGRYPVIRWAGRYPVRFGTANGPSIKRMTKQVCPIFVYISIIFYAQKQKSGDVI